MLLCLRSVATTTGGMTAVRKITRTKKVKVIGDLSRCEKLACSRAFLGNLLHIIEMNDMDKGDSRSVYGASLDSTSVYDCTESSDHRPLRSHSYQRD